MADFTIIVGVDSSLSFTEMQKGIDEIVSRLNANPPKIKVKFDDASLKTMQEALNSLQANIGAKARTPIDTGALGKLADDAQRAASASHNMSNAINEVSAASKPASETVRRMSASKKDDTRATKENTTALKQYGSVIVHAETALRNWTAAEKSKSASSREAYQQLKGAVDAVKAARAAYDGSASSVSRLQGANENLRITLREAERTIRANGDASKTLGERLGGLANKFASWLSVSQIIMRAVQAMRQAVSASIELEDAFAQLQIVTGASASQMKQFKDTAISLAKDLGRSVSDVAKSIETFSRLGYSLSDASALAKYATILANVASVDSDTATTGLTSIIKGFNMDVGEAEHVADVLVEVGQKYAVSAREMMDAYEKSGAALNATNTTFEKSAGLIAAANSAVQNSSVVGTALKTVSARIRGSKTDLEELGESVDDLAEGFSKYAGEIKAITGFDIMADAEIGKFKDLYDIFEGISGVWDRLSDTQQARVAEILGGTRQLQVISSVIGNWEDAVGAYETAMDSAGAATRANDIYMDTATAHINQFKATFQELATDMVSGGLISSFADIGSGLLTVADAASKVLGVFGSFPGIIGAASAAMTFKNVGELSDQFQLQIILRVECAHEAFTNGNMNETMRRLAA